MIKQAINQIYITFEPWKDYEPIFSAMRDIMKDEYGCELVVSQGRIEKITNGYSRGYWKYREIELHSKIWLRDFLIKISPIVSAGIVRFSYSMTQLEFHPLAKEWIDKVMENEGKA